MIRINSIYAIDMWKWDFEFIEKETQIELEKKKRAVRNGFSFNEPWSFSFSRAFAQNFIRN